MRLTARGARVAPYDVTREDMLWLCRAVESEGPDERQVAAILVNGFVWNRSRGGRGSLAQWVRAYAQPVNPLWYPGGDGHEAKYAAATTDGERAYLLKKAVARRDVHSRRTQFSPRVLEAVREALAGNVGIPGPAVDYAAPNVRSTRIPLEPVPNKRNRLYTRVGAQDWLGYLSSSAGARPKPLLALFGTGLAAAAAYFATRKRGRV